MIVERTVSPIGAKFYHRTMTNLCGFYDENETFIKQERQGKATNIKQIQSKSRKHNIIKQNQLKQSRGKTIQQRSNNIK